MKPQYIVKRHPKPTPHKKWCVMDRRDQSVVSSHYFRKNAVATAAMTNSVARKYGSLV